MQIVTTWLYEPVGYLDVKSNLTGLTARETLAVTPTLDILAWWRTNLPGGFTFGGDPEPGGFDNAFQLAMWWWIRSKSGVNITNPQKPPETPQWITYLNQVVASIDAGFSRGGVAVRNEKTVQLYDSTGAQAGTMPAGNHLASQQSMCNKVLNVLN